MSEKIGLQDQIEGVIAILEIARTHSASIKREDEDRADAAIKTLVYLRNNEDAVRLGIAITNDDRTQMVLKEFPGAKIVSAKKITYDPDAFDILD